MTRPLALALLLVPLLARADAGQWKKTYKAFLADWASENPHDKVRGLDRLAKSDSRRDARVLLSLMASDLPEEPPAALKAEYKKLRADASRALTKGRTEKIVDGKKKYTYTPEARAENKRITALANVVKAKMALYAQLRTKVVDAASRLRSKEAVDTLVDKGLRHKDVRAVVGTLAALGKSRLIRIAPKVRKLVASKDLRVAATAIGAIAALKDAESLKALTRALDSKAWQVRAAAAEALGVIGGPDAVRALVAAFGKEEVSRLEEDYDRALKVITGISMGSKTGWANWLESMDAQLAEVCKREIARREAAEKAAREKAEAEKKEKARIAKLRKEGKPIPKKKKKEKKKKDGEVVGETKGGFYGIPLKSKRLVFVVDVSGSMSSPARRAPKKAKVAITGAGSGSERKQVSGSKLDVCKQELVDAIKRLPKDALFNIVYYQSSVAVYRNREGLIKATQANKRETIKWIDDTLRPAGGTNIYDALVRAFALAADDPRDALNYKHGVDTIYFLTDGSPSSGAITDTAVIIEKITALNASRRVAIHTIGVGSINTRFLEALAKRNGGTFTHRK